MCAVSVAIVGWMPGSAADTNWLVTNWLATNWLVTNWLVTNWLATNSLVTNWLVTNWLAMLKENVGGGGSVMVFFLAVEKAGREFESEERGVEESR